MSNVINPLVTTNIVALRAEAVKAEAKNYGARKAYASGLNNIAPNNVAWYNLETNGQKLPDVIKVEKNGYYTDLKGIDYSNPSNAWKMIKQYAREDAINRSLFGEVKPETVEGEAEAESVGETRETRTLTLFLVDELTAMHKRAMKTSVNKPEEYTESCKLAHGIIMDAMKAMKIDVGAIGLK